MRAVDEAKLAWVSLEAIEYESMKRPDPTRRTLLAALCRRATERVAVSQAALERAKVLRAKGLGDLHAVHPASAEVAGVTVLLTVDDRFLSAASHLSPTAATRVVNPVVFAAEMSL